MHIKKGDNVKIITGKDRGKSGVVSAVLLHDEKIVVDGVNMYKKRARPKRQGEKGEIISVARPLAISNVMLVCSNCKQRTRAGIRMQAEKKERYCKKCDTRFQ